MIMGAISRHGRITDCILGTSTARGRGSAQIERKQSLEIVGTRNSLTRLYEMAKDARQHRQPRSLAELR